jgi:hypothetical protein
MSRPVTSVLRALDGGAITVAEVINRTHLSEDIVRAALETLERLGKVRPESLAPGCLSQGCGSCGSASNCSTGPVPLELGRR